MSWFKRIKEGIATPTKEKKEVPEGVWYKCPQCQNTVPAEDHDANLWVCADCGYHQRITVKEYFSILFDRRKYREINANIHPADPLEFEDNKKYAERLKESMKKTKSSDAICTATGKINKKDILIACMDFNFIGGSMGAVVGEKISRAIDYCLEHRTPLLIISKSGGARMMEAAYSLMQMAKTSAKLTLLHDAGIPYISLLTDPTTGGVTASYAMLGDINIAEPGALIGFAGPRVVKETIGKDLPEGFQTSEFVLDHGFLDAIVPRQELKEKIALALEMFEN
ncbi:MAG: acetyl-CoA carboxylase, carboxyltransferase subunit beta [Flavobacteriales bacterium]